MDLIYCKLLDYGYEKNETANLTVSLVLPTVHFSNSFLDQLKQ